MGNVLAETGKRLDPLLRDLELNYTGTYYPAGFPLRLATNSRHVLEAAEESWRYWRQAYEVEPVTFRVVIEPEGELSGPPRFRMQGQLVDAVSGPNNFASADTRSLFASFHLSEKTAADHPWMRWFYLESMAYLLLSQRYVVALHTGCIAREGRGLLLCGRSGAGKSTLSFACARAGWTYVADDCTWLLADSAQRIAIGKPYHVRLRHDAPRHFPELEEHAARTRPNGKMSIEALTSWFPEIEAAERCAVGGMVFLDRTSGGHTRLEPMPAEEAIDCLMEDLPSYGEDVNAMHERTVRGLAGVPAWRMHYETWGDALRLLSEVVVRYDF